MPDHRSCPRWQVNWQARLKLEGQEEHASCTLRDINFKGVRLCLEQELAKDSRLKLDLCLCQEATLEVEAWVVWHKNIGELNEYGVYFSKIREADKKKIQQFMNSNFKRQLQSQIWEGVSKKEEYLALKDGPVCASAQGGEKMMEDRRIFERFPVKFPLKYLDSKQNKEGITQACDVSAKGVGFVADRALAPQTPLEIWIEIPDKGEPLYIRGEVAWSVPRGVSEYRVGVDLEKADLMGLARVLRPM